MNTPKFTPGPWTVLPIEEGYFPSVQVGPELRYEDGSGTGTHRICINEGQPRGETTWGNTMEACIGNAHLIAAAPEMYEALKALRNTVDNLACHAGNCMSHIGVLPNQQDWVRREMCVYAGKITGQIEAALEKAVPL